MPARTTRPTRLATARAFARAVRVATRPGSAGLGTRLRALPRLASAVRRREYLGASNGQLLTLVASAVYAVSPADVVPEGLLGVLGLGDDALVLAYAASAFVNLTEDFLRWEADPARAAGRRPDGAGGRSGGPDDPVEGTVIR